MSGAGPGALWRDRPPCLGGYSPDPTSRTGGRTSGMTESSSAPVRGRPLGPFIETKEQLGGFILMDVRDLDEARSDG